MNDKKWNQEFAFEDHNKSFKNDSCNWKNNKYENQQIIWKIKKNVKKFLVK